MIQAHLLSPSMAFSHHSHTTLSYHALLKRKSYFCQIMSISKVLKARRLKELMKKTSNLHFPEAVGVSRKSHLKSSERKIKGSEIKKEER